MSSTLKHLLMMLAVLVLLGGVYYALSVSGFFDRGIKTSEDVRAMTDQLEREILADFTRIEALHLDDAVLRSPAFSALVDTPLIISPKPVSRENPFERY